MKHYIFMLTLVLSSLSALAQDVTDTAQIAPSTVQKEAAQEAKAKRKEKMANNSKQKLFRGMVIVGFNATQIDGDKQVGFNKAGANIGAGMLVNFPYKISLGIEILYSMKGAKSSADDYKQNGYNRSIILDYIDLPITFNYRLLPYIKLEAGLSPDLLVRNIDRIDNNINPNGLVNNSLGYRTFGMDGILGVTGILKDHWGLSFRYQYSLVRINDIGYNPSNGYFNYFDGQMRHQIISVRGLYIF